MDKFVADLVTKTKQNATNLIQVKWEFCEDVFVPEISIWRFEN